MQARSAITWNRCISLSSRCGSGGVGSRISKYTSSHACFLDTNSLSHLPRRTVSTTQAKKMPDPVQGTDYTSWSHSDLIARVTELEAKLKSQATSYTSDKANSSIKPNSPPSSTPTPARKSRVSRAFDPSKYSTRLIALKFAYLGQNYNGFEHHSNNTTPLPTIEEELWKALVKTKLIFPEAKEAKVPGKQALKKLAAAVRKEENVNWEGCEYSKCGRTDRGVSAFGQVIGIRVRSNRPIERPVDSQSAQEESEDLEEGLQQDTIGKKEVDGQDEAAAQETHAEKVIQKGPKLPPKPFDPIADELPYIHLLNRVLPPDIRVLAWCPNPPQDFSARFSCRERRYKYFFTQPAYAPVPGNEGLYQGSDGLARREGWLDIAAMREAAGHLVGLHDFRNFCKVDPSKQITNFQRRIFHADIEEITSMPLPNFFNQPSFLPENMKDSITNTSPKVYAFVIHGSAFLWHQVRHLAAILLLVGQGLERPSIVQDLLNISKMPTKPKYEMATDAPLVLWDCIFPNLESDPGETGYEDILEWIYAGDPRGGVEGGMRKQPSGEKGIWGRGGVVNDVWEVWRSRKIDELLAGSLLDVIAAKGKLPQLSETDNAALTPSSKNIRVFDGGNVARSVGPYVPVLKKQRMETVEVINARYAARKGWSTQEAVAQGGDQDGGD